MAKQRRRKPPRPPQGAATAPQGAGSPPAGRPVLERLRLMQGTGQWRLGVPAALALVCLAIGGWTFDAKLSLSGDNTEFITLARSLARGQGLSYIQQPDAHPATKYPFGFPLMLAPFAAGVEGAAGFEGAAGAADATRPANDWIAMKWLVVVLFSASVPLFYLLARREMGEGAALVAAALAATNPLLVDYGHQVMSEIPYLAFSLASLLLLQIGLEPERREWNGWLIGGFVLAVSAYYVRSVGVALLGALMVHLLWRRQWRRAGAAVGGTVLCLLPWVLRNRAAGGGGVYVKQLIQVNPYYPEQGLLNLSGLLERVAGHIVFYLQHGLPQALVPSLGVWRGPLNPASLGLLALAGYAVAVWWRRDQHRLLLIYAVFFLGTVLLWPWPGDRFVVPIIPLLVFFAVRALAQLLCQVRRFGGQSVAGVLMAASAAVLLWGNAGLLDGLARRARADYPPAWRNYYAAAQWLRANTPANVVVCARKAFWLYVASGRRAVPYPFVEPDGVLTDLDRHGVDYVVVEQLGFRQTPMFLLPAIGAHAERFDVVWQQGRPDTYVLAYRAGR